MTETMPRLPDESAFHGQAMPLVRARPAHQALFPYFLVSLGTLLVVGIAGYWWMNSAARAELEAKKLDAVKLQLKGEFEAEQLRRDQELKLKRQDQQLGEQRAAHAHLAERAELALTEVNARAAAQQEWNELNASVKNGASGRDIAANHTLLAQYTVLDQNQSSNVYNPAAVRDRIAPIEARSRKISAGNEVEAAPSPDLVAKIDSDA